MRTAFISIIFLFTVVLANAQCVNYARKFGKEKLGSYRHDGNYNATTLSEGEKAEIYKVFFSGQRYRVAISKVENLPPIHFRILDKSGNVLFDNEKHSFELVWDFEVESTQTLIVEMVVQETEGGNDESMSGCVAIMFGIDNHKT